MADNKYENKMKNIFIIFTTIVLGCTVSCNAQKKENNMTEKYDFEVMGNIPKHMMAYGVIRDDIKIVMYRMDEWGTHYNEYPPMPNYYWVQKRFYPNGNLKAIVKIVGSNLAIGETIYYDEEGRIEKVVDEDEKFGKIKVEDLLKFIEDEGHINLETGEGIESVEIREDGGVNPVSSRFGISSNVREDKYWVITIYAQPWNTYTRTAYHIDKDTGEVLYKNITEGLFPIL